jgi:hypothetical protein
MYGKDGQQVPGKINDFSSDNLLNQIEDKKMRIIVSKMLQRDPSKRPTAKGLQKLLCSTEK